VSPGTSITGFYPPGIIYNGTEYGGGTQPAEAQNNVATVKLALALCQCTNDFTGDDLGTLTLTPGVYCFTAAATLTGTLHLISNGDPNALFVFDISKSLTTADMSSINLGTGVSPCNIYWVLGSSLTLGSNSAFSGVVLAMTSISLGGGAVVNGRLYSMTAVTLIDNDVTRCD